MTGGFRTSQKSLSGSCGTLICVQATTFEPHANVVFLTFQRISTATTGKFHPIVPWCTASGPVRQGRQRSSLVWLTQHQVVHQKPNSTVEFFSLISRAP